VDLSSSILNGDTYVQVQADVKVGKIKFPNMDTPVVDPISGDQLGYIKIAPQDAAEPKKGSHIEISVNATRASRGGGVLGKTLPNGRPLPRRLKLDAESLVVAGIPILMNSRIYVGADGKDKLFAGMALGLPVIDQATVYVPVPLNLFFGFKIRDPLRAVAGVYTSPLPMHSGLAFFAEKSAGSTSLITSSVDDLNQINLSSQLKLLRLLR